MHFREMAQRLKHLRLKQETLQNNMLYTRVKKSAQLWFLRAQTTKYIRQKAKDLENKYKLLRLNRCFNAIKQRLKAEKKGGRKFA